MLEGRGSRRGENTEINQEAIVTLLEPRPQLRTLPISPKERLLNLAGSISHEDYLEMEEALLDTEKVMLNRNKPSVTVSSRASVPPKAAFNRALEANIDLLLRQGG